VQRRRELPTRLTQRFQLFVQNRIIAQVIGRAEPLPPPLLVRLLARFPFCAACPPPDRHRRSAGACADAGVELTLKGGRQSGCRDIV